MAAGVSLYTRDGLRQVLELPDPKIAGYTLLHRDGTPFDDADTDRRIYALGTGGFGSVYLAHDGLQLPRAIKVIPEDFVESADLATDTMGGSLFQEIGLTTQRPRAHVLPILEYSDQGKDLAGDAFSWYSMPYVDGEPIGEFFKNLLKHHEADLRRDRQSRVSLKDLFLELMHDVLTGMTELYLDEIVHMDLSPTNIMVSLSGCTIIDTLDEVRQRSRAFIIDLGAAKHVSATKTSRTRLIYNKHYFPVELLDDLSFEVIDKRFYVRRDRLARYWKVIDVFCFGKTLQAIFLNQRDIWQASLGDDYEYIEKIIERCLRFRTPVFSDPTALRAVFEAIRPMRGRGTTDSMILSDRAVTLRVRAGTRVVKCAPPTDAIVEHPQFQRLKLQSQLPLMAEVFPGATHSRFTHALRSFNLLKSYLRALSRVPDFRLEFQRAEIDQTLVAGLIHDIGQYPFSHAIEDIRQLADKERMALEVGEDVPLSDPRLVHLVPFLSVRYDQDLVAGRLTEPGHADGKHGQASIAEILEDHELDADVIQYMFSKHPDASRDSTYQNLGRSLIVGPLAADRVSYLLYDSFQSGVAYGQGIDVGSLVEGLTVYTAGGAHAAAVGVEEAAVAAVESVVGAVYWMYQNVYWHHANRAVMAAVRLAVTRLLEAGVFNFQDYIKEVGDNTDNHAIGFIRAKYDQWRQPGQANPIESIASNRRVGYLRVLSLSPFVQDDNPDTVAFLTSLYERIVSGISFARERFLLDSLRSAAFWQTTIADGQLLLDLPIQPSAWSQFGVGGANAIPVRRRMIGTKRHLGWEPLATHSPFLTALNTLKSQPARKVRIFLDRAKYRVLPATVREALVHQIRSELDAITRKW